jgi:hypothetical protein
VDAARLSELSGVSVRNLGTLSFLNVASFGSLLENYVGANSTPPEKIVLLVHPEFVRRNSPSRAHLASLENYLAATDFYYGVNRRFDLRRLLGVHIVEGRLLGRLPVPLPDRFGEEYGFTTDLMRYLENHQGSVADPRMLAPENLTGSSDYRIAKSHAVGIEKFMSAVPEGAQVYLGLTPLPESFPSSSYQSRYDALLSDWNAIFVGTEGLIGLPAVLEDNQFATKAHLKSEAALEYTETLYRLISQN